MNRPQLKNPLYFAMSALFLCGFLIHGVWGFGMNKVQYNKFNWTFIQTKHYNIYYPKGGDSVAYFAARHVEEMTKHICESIGHQLTARIPIILHNTHAEFEQTNVIRFPLHEAIGGFTESFKNRVVLPFEGNYIEFYRVLKHELVHAVVNNMLIGRSVGGGMGRPGGFQFPLWINEGLAEYLSSGWDLSSEFFMMDATLSGYVSSPVNEFGGFMAYKGGQMFFHFMEQVYGKGTIKKFIQSLRSARNLNKAFEQITNMSLEEAGELWLRELRYIYWPELGRRQHGKHIARRLTRHGRDLSYFNLQPTISPNNKEIAFFSDVESREGVFILDLETEKLTRSVIQGGTRGRHESFHSFKSGLSWGPGSKRLAIVSKGGGKDVIHIIDSKKGKVLEEINVPLQAILSPNWSRDGRYICFSGILNGYTDIYIWDRDDKKLTRLTNDGAYDGKPVFSPSGRYIAFESNRSSVKGLPRLPFLNIYRYDRESKELCQITKNPFDDKNPSYGAFDSICVFVSNRSGINNLYMSTDSSGEIHVSPLSNVLAGCFTPSWSTDGELLAFTIFEQGGWDIFLMKDPLKKRHDKPLATSHFMSLVSDSAKPFFRSLDWDNLSSYKKDTVPKDSTIKKKKTHWLFAGRGFDSDTIQKPDPSVFPDSSDYLDNSGQFKQKPYKPIFSLDMTSVAVGASNFEGPLGGGMVVLSDLMGDQEIMIGLSMNGDINNSYLEVQYNFLPYRIDYLLGGFYKSFDASGYTFGGKELSYGLNGAVLYPLSLYTRWQFNMSAQFIERDTKIEVEKNAKTDQNKDTVVTKIVEIGRNSGIFYPTLSWSHDNTQWGMVGPVNGQRILGRVSLVPPVFEEDMFFYVADLDVRKYWRYFKKYTLAARVSAGLSQAVSGYKNPHQFWVGGDNFLNIHPWARNEKNIPDDIDVERIYFSDFGLPLRGYRFFEFAGNRKLLMNLEFRFPLIQHLVLAIPPPGLRLPPISGVVYLDYGAAWTRGEEFDGNQGIAHGYGLRVNLGVFVLRYTRSWPWTKIGNHKKTQWNYWSLGAEF